MSQEVNSGTVSGAEAVEVAVSRLKRDIVAASKDMTKDEIRFLVDAYYRMQENRLAAAAQIRSLTERKDPAAVLIWLGQQDSILENQVKRVLDSWTDHDPTSIWAKSITGIGPVISAGLAAYIDMNQAPTAGHIWSFAGIDKGRREKPWEKGQKRPWCAMFKTLCTYKIGESFVKFQNNENDQYGKYYVQRKAYEIKRNDEGYNKEHSEWVLSTKKFNKSTDAYKAYSQGKLPPAQIHARARRYAVKIFLSHYHHIAHKITFKKDPPKPFVIEHLGHAHIIEPPNMHLVQEYFK